MTLVCGCVCGSVVHTDNNRRQPCRLTCSALGNCTALREPRDRHSDTTGYRTPNVLCLRYRYTQRRQQYKSSVSGRMAAMRAAAAAAPPALPGTPRQPTPHRTFKHLQLRFAYSLLHSSGRRSKPPVSTSCSRMDGIQMRNHRCTPCAETSGAARRHRTERRKTMQRAMSVVTFQQRQAKNESLVLSDVSLTALPQAAPFARQPSLLAPFHLLDNLPADRQTQTHLICEMILGTSQSPSCTPSWARCMRVWLCRLLVRSRAYPLMQRCVFVVLRGLLHGDPPRLLRGRCIPRCGSVPHGRSESSSSSYLAARNRMDTPKGSAFLY